MIGGKAAIYGGIFAGALLLASTAANWFLWRALQSEQQAHARAQAAVQSCAATNADNQRVIDGLNASLDELVARRATERAAWAKASRERATQVERLRQRLADIPERDYDDCQEWADMPVCGPVADRLRQ